MFRRFLSCILGLMLSGFVAAGSANAVGVIIDDLSPVNVGDTFLLSHKLTGGEVLADVYTMTVGSDPLAFIVGVQSFTPSPTTSPFNIGIANLKLKWKDTDTDTVINEKIITDGSGNMLSLPSASLIYSFAVVGLIPLKLEVLGTALTDGGTYDIALTAVPIPAAGLLFGSALAGAGFLSRCRKKRTQIAT